jgi:adenylate cyclase
MKELLRGSIAQRVQIGSGVVLFAFAATHFLNHALGLIDLETMHTAQRWRWAVTRSWPGSAVLVAALALHMVLALTKLSQRASYRLQWWEYLQIGLGLLIPFLLLPHIVNTRVASLSLGVNDNYLYELARLWPGNAPLQSLLLLAVWTHGCIGIHFWLRINPTYRRLLPLAVFFAIAVPLAALGGFMVAGRTVARLIETPAAFDEVKALTRWPDAAGDGLLARYRTLVRILAAVAVAGVAGTIAVRYFARLTQPRLSIRYTGGATVKAPPGLTLLEISQMGGVPHAAVCGGRGRCSTCRVRIEDGASTLAPPNFAEAFTLASIAAPRDVRLACQIRPTAPLTVTRLIHPSTTPTDVSAIDDGDSAGAEKPLAVLFLDMRDFTSLAQGRLPYDMVFILNEFFAAAGQAIDANGGWIDKFLGDGLLAIFGQFNGVEAGCKQALRAARAIDLALDHLNAKLEAELRRPLRVGIGIHAGRILVGRIGHGDHTQMTVIGDAVNVASRLEALSKELGCQLVVSRDVAKSAGWFDVEHKTAEVTVRGMKGPLEVVCIPRGRDLPVSILGGEVEAAGTDRRGVA